jgi:hypothetical protein
LSGSRWVSWGVRLYYALGFSYYIYQWILVGGGVGLLLSAGTYVYGSPILYPAIAGVISLSLLIAGLIIFVVNLRKRYKGANPGLKLHSSKTTYRILPDHRYEYRRELEVEAAFDGVDHFIHVLGWSGGGTMVAAADFGHQVAVEDHERSNDRKLRLSFPPQRKRAKFKLRYSLSMEDTERKARNFFRTNISEKVRLLTTEIEFPAAGCPPQYKTSIYMSMVAAIPVFEKEMPINRQDHKVIWEIRKPRFDYNYVITW